jgi:hypothetical protein
MSERFLPIDRPLHSPPPELIDGGGREGTAIGIDVKYAQGDDDASIRGNEGCERTENISGLDTVSANVDSFKNLHLIIGTIR